MWWNKSIFPSTTTLYALAHGIRCCLLSKHPLPVVRHPPQQVEQYTSTETYNTHINIQSHTDIQLPVQ